VTSTLCSLVYQSVWLTLPPECDQISCSSAPARRSCFGLPLHVAKFSCLLQLPTVVAVGRPQTVTQRCPACLTTSSVVCSPSPMQRSRSIFNLRWSDHVTPTLMKPHWLSAVVRVDFKTATLVFRFLHDLALVIITLRTWTLDIG